MVDLEKQLVENFKFYQAYNKIRTEHLLELMPSKKRPLFYALSFLLHVNLKEFPGYIKDENTPCGIERYTISNDLEISLKKLFPGQSLHNRVLISPSTPECYIKSLLLMGSVGSVAHTAKSDFDFWVCINEGHMDSNQLKLLKTKLLLIEEWSKEEHDLEVHFFPTDIKKVQKNYFGEADKESAGTAQARFLKEEFYRTFILVAGKMPFWCLTPAGISDEEYVKYKEVAKQSPNLETNLLIDIGNLNEITTEEFFGAALWQMNKAMDSPYKSVLKMAMLEGFLDPEVKSQLLCNIVKSRIHEKMPEKKDWKHFDPYVVMFDHILHYYKIKKRTDVIDLLETCFYIKSGFKATKYYRNKNNLNFKEKIILDYTESWRWDQNKLDDLNDFKEWGFEKVLSLGKEVHNFLIQTYRNLADRLKTENKVKQLISDQDMTVLGRKLFSFYSPKPGKIQLMKRAFEEGLWQDDITFSADYNKQRKIIWSIYRGQLTKQSLLTSESKYKLLTQSQNIVNIVIWAIFNQMLDRKTSLTFIPNPSPVSLADIQYLMNITLDTFPVVKISSLKNDALLSSSKKVQMLIVLNFDSPRWTKEIETISIIYATSWGELFCELYQAKEGKEKILQYLAENPSGGTSDLKKNYKVFVPKGQHAKKLYSALSSEALKLSIS